MSSHTKEGEQEDAYTKTGIINNPIPTYLFLTRTSFTHLQVLPYVRKLHLHGVSTNNRTTACTQKKM